MAYPVPPFTRIARFAPLTRLASKLRRSFTRQQARARGLPVLLLKAAVRRATGGKRRVRHEPDAWRTAWHDGGKAGWPVEPVTGVVEHAGVRLMIERCAITGSGLLWLDGWAIGADCEAFRLKAGDCSIEWQETFATLRPDVVQELQLRLVGRDAQVGVQILASVVGYQPGRSRLALIGRTDGAAPKLVVPVVPDLERSGSMWHSVYDAMRHHGQRDVAYLETSVTLLRDLRKADWRERNASICQAIDEAMSGGAGLKVLILSRRYPNVAYLNLHLLAGACVRPAEFIVCSMGQAAIRRASEYRPHLASLGAHRVRFVSGEVGTPSSELIERFAVACRRRGSSGLVVYDDVAVAGAMGSLNEALRQDTLRPMAWPRQFPNAGSVRPVFAEPLAANGGPGPYWRSAGAMEYGGIGALLFDPTDTEIPSVPPFETRGFGLEYLLKSSLAGIPLSQETMLDLLDPAGQRGAHALDMLMLFAGKGQR